MLPAGDYYIGDPCYVINEWNEFCDVWFSIEDGVFMFHGDKVCVYSTQYGDGCYPCSNGAMLGVDAGLIGAIPVVMMNRGGEEDGTIVTFSEPFRCHRDQNGRMHFGHVDVMTGDEGGDEDDVCPECGR